MDIDKLIDDVVLSETQKNKDSKKLDQKISNPKDWERGRKNRGLTAKHAQEYSEETAQLRKDFRRTKQSETFNHEIIEKVNGEIIEAQSAEEFKELYQLTCESVLEQFKEENADLVKKHPNEWYRKVLIQIKKQVPKVGVEEVEKLEAIWDTLYSFLVNIGITPCFQIFSLMTNMYDDTLKERGKVSPKHLALTQKIYKESKSALLLDLTNNPYTQANKMYLSKALYGVVEQNQPKQIEVNHHIENYGNISAYRLTDEK